MQCIVTYATGTYLLLSKVKFEISIFNFEYLSSAHSIFTWARMRIRGYFSKPKWVHEEKFGKHSPTSLSIKWYCFPNHFHGCVYVESSIVGTYSHTSYDQLIQKYNISWFLPRMQILFSFSLYFPFSQPCILLQHSHCFQEETLICFMLPFSFHE